jgi:hypothetical protein
LGSISDLWNPADEELLGVISSTNGSRVLVSTRIRTMVDERNSNSIELALPADEDACNICPRPPGAFKCLGVPRRFPM